MENPAASCARENPAHEMAILRTVPRNAILAAPFCLAIKKPLVLRGLREPLACFRAKPNRAKDLVYRITLEGYGKNVGGFSGKVLANADRFEIVGGRNMSGNTVRMKTRPYGSR